MHRINHWGRFYLNRGWRRPELVAALLTFCSRPGPVVQATAEALFGAPGGAIRSLLPVLGTVWAAMGSYHTLAGATAMSTNPPSPIKAKVGQPLSVIYSVTGTPGGPPMSYKVTSGLPTGLAPTNGSTVNGAFVTFSGTPTQSGNFTVKITAYKGTNGDSQGKDPYSKTFTINIDPATPPPVSIFKDPPTVELAPGQKWNPQLGFIYDSAYPYVYLFGMPGWIYVVHANASESNGFFFYDFERARWAWTQSATYPWCSVLSGPLNGQWVEFVTVN